MVRSFTSIMDSSVLRGGLSFLCQDIAFVVVVIFGVHYGCTAIKHLLHEAGIMNHDYSFPSAARSGGAQHEL